MKPYKGTKYLTVEHRYADGWAYNPTISRWIKIASQQKKNAIEAHPALVVSLQSKIGHARRPLASKYLVPVKSGGVVSLGRGIGVRSVYPALVVRS